MSITAANGRLKRAYEPPARDDSTRILIDRLWPRGMATEQKYKARRVIMMKGMTLAAFLVATCVAAPPVYAQQVPATPAEVAKPGGKIPGAPKLALVKVADGFHDPVGVTAANDGSGRIFVVERAGRVRVVGKDGKVLPD